MKWSRSPSKQQWAVIERHLDRMNDILAIIIKDGIKSGEFRRPGRRRGRTLLRRLGHFRLPSAGRGAVHGKAEPRHAGRTCRFRDQGPEGLTSPHPMTPRDPVPWLLCCDPPDEYGVSTDVICQSSACFFSVRRPRRGRAPRPRRLPPARRKTARAPEPVRPVKVVKIEPGAATRQIVFSGSVKARTEAGARLQGRRQDRRAAGQCRRPCDRRNGARPPRHHRSRARGAIGGGRRRLGEGAPRFRRERPEALPAALRQGVHRPVGARRAPARIRPGDRCRRMRRCRRASRPPTRPTTPTSRPTPTASSPRSAPRSARWSAPASRWSSSPATATRKSRSRSPRTRSATSPSATGSTARFWADGSDRGDRHGPRGVGQRRSRLAHLRGQGQPAGGRRASVSA